MAGSLMHKLFDTAGTNAQRPLAEGERDYKAPPTRFHNILRHLLPVVLRLAASPEPVAAQLFGPLVTALVHWFTRAARRCSVPAKDWAMRFSALLAGEGTIRPDFAACACCLGMISCACRWGNDAYKAGHHVDFLASTVLY